MSRAILALARLVHATRPNEIPDAVMERAADCILDALGSAAAGLGAASTTAMSRAFPRQAGEARIWFTGETCDPATAATLNAMAATALDVDDGHRMAAGHPGAAIIAASLAAASPETSGEDLLAAVVLGYETSVRVALARVPEQHVSTVSGRWSGTGAAAAAARLYGLPPETIAQSILVAEQHAPRTGSAASHGFAGSDVKEGIAWSVFTALRAVDLARAGFRGYPDTFEQGVLYSPSKLVERPDDFAAIHGLFFKPYACCRWIHAAVDALLEVIGREALPPDRIDHVTVRTFDRAVALGNRVRPASEAEAQFSIPFVLSVAAIKGRGALLPLDSLAIEDEDVLRFGERIEIRRDGELQALFPRLAPSIVEVVSSGRAVASRVDAAFGDPANPMGRSDLVAKFHRLADPVLGRERAASIARALSELRQRPASELADLVGASRATLQATPQAEGAGRVVPVPDHASAMIAPANSREASATSSSDFAKQSRK